MVNKTIVIGDTHGRNDWKRIVNQEFDRIIFIGDYLDTHDKISGEEQGYNFQDILQFKKDNPNKVVLLIGNHDCHYMTHWNEQYSGFQSGMQWKFRDILNQALKENLLQMCHVQGKFLFSHAGVSKTWLEYAHYTFDEPLMSFINETFKYFPKYFKFNGRDPYGDDITQSPVWIRPQSLFEDGLKEYTQIVGHTTMKKINPPKGDSNMWFIDTLGTSGEYIIIEDKQVKISK